MFQNIAAGITVLAVITSAVAQETYSHAEALEKIEAAGITIASSGSCSDRNIVSCTSLEQIRRNTIDSGVIILKEASQCDITITGGTEVGHGTSTYSHYNGYKLDYRLNTCLNDYITKRYTYLGIRGDGAKKYTSAAGNIYALEGNHWDVTYY
ncbi:hypothetical protein HA402_006083 [Bradysia odoriphaga]|nr:hypothetical protein HA402_006083 [Bradysia odoriphaga]